MLTDGRYGGRIEPNTIEEFVCITIIIKRRDARIAESVLQSAGDKSKAFDHYLASLIPGYSRVLEQKEEFMKKELENLKKTDWSTTLDFKSLNKVLGDK